MSGNFFCEVVCKIFEENSLIREEKIVMYLVEDQLEQYIQDEGVYSFNNPTLGVRTVCQLGETRRIGDLTEDMIYTLHQTVNHTDFHSALVYRIEERLGNLNPL